MRDLYEILGVSRDADPEAIKRAYRRLARELHPDAGGDEERFKELTTAYEVLRNPQARANYDRYGDPRGPGGLGDGVGFGDFSDLIDAFFNGFGGGRTSARVSNAGRDALVDLSLTLEEAASGGPHDVDLRVAKTCDHCAGSGAAPGTQTVICETCAGHGLVQQDRPTVFGVMTTTTTCPTCAGTGRRIPNRCPACEGQGRRQVIETVTVEVPPGVDDGTRLKLAGRGEAGRNGGPAGDLYVRTRIRSHPLYTRDGNDLHVELQVPMVQAALGATLTMATIDGERQFHIPAGTQSGDVVTLRRAGMPRLSGGGARGNLHIHCRVTTPTDLDMEQERLLRELAELRGEDADEPDDHRGLFGRLREAFGG